MTERAHIRYTYKGVEAWEEFQGQLRQIIQQDTDQYDWPETRSLPPIGIPPPLSAEGVEKLKGLSGVNVEELPDEKD